MSSEITGSNLIISKTVQLSIGDNKYYIIVEDDANNINVYTVVVRRRPLYTVTFNSNGGTPCEKQIIEEGSFASAQTSSKEGYTFSKWDYDFSNPIMKNTTINASWTPNTYVITYDVNGGYALSAITQTVTYDSQFSLIIPIRDCYIFDGWYYNNNNKIDKNTWDIVNNVSLIAKWKSTFEYQILSSSECEITKYKGLKKDIIIPNSIYEYSVTSIGDYAFYECDKLTIYCETLSKPIGWSTYWNESNCPVIWGINLE